MPPIAGLAAASIAGRSPIGATTGSRAVRLGRAAETATDDGAGAPCHAHIAGFDLHAGVAVPAGDGERLEHLCRYVLRPPIAQDALSIAPGGRVCLALRRLWRDGTRALLFDPLDFLGRLAALTPKPRVNLLLYHGVFAPHAARRRAAVARARETADGPAESGSSADRVTGLSPPLVAGGPATSAGPPGPAMSGQRGWVRWADLLRRVFEIDVLHCARCGGRLRFVAAVDDPEVVRHPRPSRTPDLDRAAAAGAVTARAHAGFVRLGVMRASSSRDATTDVRSGGRCASRWPGSGPVRARSRRCEDVAARVLCPLRTFRALSGPSPVGARSDHLALCEIRPLECLSG